MLIILDVEQNLVLKIRKHCYILNIQNLAFLDQ